MGLALPELWELAKPLSTGLFKGAVASVQERGETADFLDDLPLVIESVLTSLNSIRAKCSTAGREMVTRQPSEEETGYFRILSPLAPLRLWLNCERDLDGLLCELACGGTGVECGEDEPSRPISKLEMRLKRKVLESMVEAIVKKLHDILDTDFVVTRTDDDAAEWLEPVQMFEVKLLVNAFSFGCELSIQFHAGDFDALFQQEKQGGGTAYEALQNCLFQVEALLPPEQFPLDTVLALRPGGLLALGLSPSSSVVLTCGGTPVFIGDFRPVGDRAEIVLKPSSEEKALAEAPVGGGE